MKLALHGASADVASPEGYFIGPSLSWLPIIEGWRERVKLARGGASWEELVGLAKARLDFVSTLQLDRRLTTWGPPPEGAAPRLRMGVLASATVDHLLPALRVSALRRGWWLETYTSDFGQYNADVENPASALYAFGPDVVLLSFDSMHLIGRASNDEGIENAADRVARLWHTLRDRLGCQVIQQTVMPTAPSLMGGNEYKLEGSPRRLMGQLNGAFRSRAMEAGVDLMALDDQIMLDGLEAWYDPVLWHRAKQEISPVAAPYYGELALRLVAARRGCSAKCLVLDLDNTLWGGVIGDDGLAGIIIGQGSSLGEAHLAVQSYAKGLSDRGIILAVCSKNDEANAVAPFEQHPDMLLKRGDIACFVANWKDKASNLRSISATLNIGLDSLVFVDDNPFERAIVRRELPMVMTPELPEDPALYPQVLAAAGYFESIGITTEDFDRTKLYQVRATHEALRSQATDMAGFLESLAMTMTASRFDVVNMQRITQLINKTNQFNLTTRRYTEEQVTAVMSDSGTTSLQIRLTDNFADHGIIAVIIAQLNKSGELEIGDWLMSCRVLGRDVEHACLNLLAAYAEELGAIALVGRYEPTEKNGLVADLYSRLGFGTPTSTTTGGTIWRLELANYHVIPTFVQTIRR